MANIVFLHTDFRLGWIPRLNALNDVCLERGHKLTVIEIFGGGGNYAFSNVAAISNSNRIDWHILFKGNPSEYPTYHIKKRIQTVLNELKPNFIFSGAIAFHSGAAGVDWAVRHNCRIIIMDDAKIENVRRNFFIEKIKRFVYSGADGMMFPAPQWNETGFYWGFPLSRIFYGVDSLDYKFWNSGRNICQSKGNIFLVVGRQIGIKNIGAIIRGFALSDVKAELCIIGNGPLNKELKEIAKKTDCAVSFHTFIAQDELRDLYYKAQALIVGSISETWGAVIAEAMAAGCPVIASRQCGAALCMIKDKINGVLMQNSSPETISDAIKFISGLSRDKYYSVCENAANEAKNWDLPYFTFQVLEAIEKIMMMKKRKASIIARVFIKAWTGRYKSI